MALCIFYEGIDVMRLKKIADRFGNTITYDWNKDYSKLEKITNGNGVTFIFDYFSTSEEPQQSEVSEEPETFGEESTAASQYFIKTITDSRGTVYSYGRDTDNPIVLKYIKIEYEGQSNTIHYGYNSDALLNTISYEENAPLITINYDQTKKDPISDIANEVGSISYSGGTSETFSRDSASKSVTHTNKNGIASTYFFDYDDLRPFLCSKVAIGNLTTEYLEYTADNYLLHVKYQMGNEHLYTYHHDDTSLLIPAWLEEAIPIHISESSQQTYLTYWRYLDKRKIGNATSTTITKGTYTDNITGNSAVDLVTSATYNDFGQVLTSTAVDGTVTTYAYESTVHAEAGTDRLSKTSITHPTQDPAVTVSEVYTYTDDGRIATHTSITGALTSYTYDGPKLTKVVVTGAGKTLTTTYSDHDSYYRPLTVTSSSSGVSKYTYTSLGQLESISGAEVKAGKSNSKPIVNYTYYNNGLLHTQTSRNPVANSAGAYSYIDQTSTKTYNDLGQVLTTTTPSEGNSGITSFTYDTGKTRLARVDNPDATFTSYLYDTLGRLEKATNPTGKMRYGYNDNGNITDTWITYGSSAEKKQSSTVYDYLGRAVRVSDEINNTKTENLWNHLGRLSDSKSFAGNQLIAHNTFIYFANGDLQSSKDELRGITSAGTMDYANNKSTSKLSVGATDYLSSAAEYNIFGTAVKGESNGIHSIIELDSQNRIFKSASGNSATAANNNLAKASEVYRAPNGVVDKIKIFERAAAAVTIETSNSGSGPAGKMTDEKGVVNANTLNKDGSVKSQAEDTADKNRRTDSYQSTDKRVAVMLRDNQATKVTYNLKGQLTRTDYFYGLGAVSAESLATKSANDYESYEYDDKLRVTKYRHKDGSLYIFEYYASSVANAYEQLKSISRNARIIKEFQGHNIFGIAESVIEYTPDAPRIKKTKTITDYHETSAHASYGTMKSTKTILYGAADAVISAGKEISYNTDAIGRPSTITYSSATDSGDFLKVNYVNGSLIQSITRGSDELVSYDRNTHLGISDKTVYGSMNFNYQFKSEQHGILNGITYDSQQIAKYESEQRGMKSAIGQWSNRVNQQVSSDSLRRYASSTGAAKFEKDTFKLDNFDNAGWQTQVAGHRIDYTMAQGNFKNQIARFTADAALLKMSGSAVNGDLAPEKVTMNFNMRAPTPAGMIEFDRNESAADYGYSYNTLGNGTGWIDINGQAIDMSLQALNGSLPGTSEENSSGIPLFNTDTSEAVQWEMALPDGTYYISITAAYVNDAGINSTSTFDLEGVSYPVDNFQQSAYRRVEISDGKLTVAANKGSAIDRPYLLGISIKAPVTPLANFNFGASSIEEGWNSDLGLAYGSGQTYDVNKNYGWLNSDRSANIQVAQLAGVSGNSASNISMSDSSTTHHTWEMDVDSNKYYYVQIIGGHFEDTNSTQYGFSVEGQPLLKGWNTPYQESLTDKFTLISPVIRVKVSDGKLSISGISTAKAYELDGEVINLPDEGNQICEIRVWQEFETGSITADSRITVNMEYDGRGRVVEDQNFIYSWDTFDRIISVTDKNYSLDKTTPEKVDYSYSPDGQRVSNTYSAPQGSSMDAVKWVNTRHVYSGAQLIEEYHFETDKIYKKYFYEPGINYPLSVEQYTYLEDGSLDKVTTYIAITDERGSLVGVADESGTVLEKIFYNGTGLMKVFDASIDTSAITQADLLDGEDPQQAFRAYRSQYLNFGYTGMYKDPFTGLYHTLYRDMDPIHNRWLSEDPAGYQDGLNLYFCYVGVDGRDPLGLALYAFDGTGNHDKAKNLNGTVNYKTNIRILLESYTDGDKKKYYAYGIGSGYHADGTAYTKKERGYVLNRKITVELGSGKSMEARVEWMIGNLKKSVAAGDNTIDLIGFSRGGASATMFLNRVSELKKEKGFGDLKVRFVSIFDQVPSKIRLRDQIKHKIKKKFGRADNDIYKDHTTDASFVLPKNLNPVKLLHLVALDEKREPFAFSNLQGATQVGFRGVHADIGGGYPYSNFFTFITREYVIEQAEAIGLNIFHRKHISGYDKGYRHRARYKAGMANPNYGLNILPTYNLKLKGPIRYKTATRVFPADMTPHWTLRMFPTP